LGLKFMTIKLTLASRKFPRGTDNRKDKEIVRNILFELVEDIKNKKKLERSRSLEQFCGDTVRHMVETVLYELSKAAHLPSRVATLGFRNRTALHRTLLRVENNELQALNMSGYHSFVKRYRIYALQQNYPPPPYLTPEERRALADAPRTPFIPMAPYAYAGPPPPPSSMKTIGRAIGVEPQRIGKAIGFKSAEQLRSTVPVAADVGIALRKTKESDVEKDQPRKSPSAESIPLSFMAKAEDKNSTVTKTTKAFVIGSKIPRSSSSEKELAKSASDKEISKSTIDKSM